VRERLHISAGSERKATLLRRRALACAGLHPTVVEMLAISVFVIYERIVHGGGSVPSGYEKVSHDPYSSAGHRFSGTLVTEAALDSVVTLAAGIRDRHLWNG
jgi:hypothetical protein